MKPLRVYDTDFVCVRENVLWLLGHRAFYDYCASFQPLWVSVQQLYEYMKQHGFMGSEAKQGCKNCDAYKVVYWQNMLLDRFAQILLWNYDSGRIQELQTALRFVAAAKKVEYKRLLLVYSGKATGNKERVVIVS